MASTLACVGFGVEGQDGFKELVRTALDASVLVTEIEGQQLRRFEDSSGARIELRVDATSVVDLHPTLAWPVATTRLGDVRGPTTARSAPTWSTTTVRP